MSQAKNSRGGGFNRGTGGERNSGSGLRGRRAGSFRQTAQLILQLGDAIVQALQNLSCRRRERHTVLAMVPRRVAAFEGIVKLFAAGAAGAQALAGSGWVGHGKFGLVRRGEHK